MRRLRVPLVPRWLRWSAVLFVAATVFYFSVLVSPGPAGRELFGPLWDKYLHAVAYAGLALVTAYATANWRATPYRRAAAVLVATVAFGVLIEFAQAAVPYRQFSPADMVANAAGALLVVGWFAIEARVRYRRVDPADLVAESLVPALGREE
jgi:VanZ family protein